MNAAFAQYSRQRKANVFDAFDVIMVGRDVENRIFIVGNGAANAAQCSGNAVESGPFAVDNLIGSIADAVIDLSFNFRSERFAEFFRQFVERNRAGISGRPDQHFAVTVFADNIGMNGLRGNAEVIAEQGTEAGGIKNRAGADNALFGKPESLRATSVIISAGLEVIIKVVSGAA